MNLPLRPAASPPRPLVGSVVQAIAVLRHLGTLDRPQGVTAIAGKLGISPSSCFNILKTLAAEDLATFDTVTRAYAIGPGAADLARRALGRDAVLGIARPALDALAAEHDVAAGLWRLGRDERLTLTLLAESEAATRIHLVVGQRQPAEAGATGRAVLAARRVPDAEIARVFETLRWQDAPALDVFVAQVGIARARGWATDTDQIIRGVTTQAAVVTDGEGRVRFCLSASMFTGRAPQQLDLIGESVRDTALAIGRAAYGAGA